MSDSTEPSRISTQAQRGRVLVQLLDEKLDAIRATAVDELRYDQHRRADGLRIREMAWRLGPTEFLVNYHEVRDVPGTAVFRVRTQAARLGSIGDDWLDLATLGELDDALRMAERQRAYTAADLKAMRHSRKHEGATPEQLILVGLSGSHAYGLHHEGYLDAETGQAFPASDVDTRGVFVVPTKAILSLDKPAQLVEQKDTDTVYDEVERFLDLCLKGNPERLEMLASRKTLVTPEGQWLEDHQHIFLSKQIIKTYGGYAKQQLYRIERKQERAHKPALHLIRLLLTGIRILQEGRVDCDMSAHRERLLAIRFGKTPLTEVFEWHRELEAEFARAAEKTRLPEHPDRAQANELLLTIRRNHLQW